MSRAVLIQGHVLDLLRATPANSVPCVVTSPPYWGQRDYGLAPVMWGGGDPEHAHAWGTDLRRPPADGAATRGASSLLLVKGRGVVAAQDGGKRSTGGAFCACGAWLGCLGLEPDPWLYLEHLVEIFEEVRRVLRPDGTLWLNLGDSYANDAKWGGRTGGTHVAALHGTDSKIGRGKRKTGLKPKDLIGIPWRVAFALQDAGWWLRADNIWHKTNAMPESVRDRPARAHEYMFLLAKSARYYYDGEAVRTALAPKTFSAFGHDRKPSGGGELVKADNWGRGVQERRPRVDEAGEPVGANLRSVWPIASQPYPEAHFATFPPNLVEPCILAGSRRGDEVLDIFSGAATTGLVALRHGRSYRGFEASGPYLALAAKRLADDIAARAPLFDSIEVQLEEAC